MVPATNSRQDIMKGWLDSHTLTQKVQWKLNTLK